MPISNSVIRRYTPPTCTLEVLAQSSPLSRWTGRTVLKQLNFELRFDDPRLPEERRVPIRGDRDQLEALCDAVTIYVQEFLQQSPESFWVTFSGPLESSEALDDSETKDLQQSSLSTKTLKALNSEIPRTNIYLEPSSYLTHNLFLGSLANQTSGSVIQLTLLQLFDLASALDEYSADIMALPTLNTSSSSPRLPTWAPVAAVVALALGLTPVTWQYANSIRQKQQQTAKTAAPQEAEIALNSSPSLDFPTPQAGLTPPPPTDLQSSLPTLGSTPPLPTSALPSRPQTLPNSTFSNNSQIFPNSSLPTASQTSTNSSLSAKSQISSSSSLPTASQTAPNSNLSKAPPLFTKDALTIPGATTSTLPTNQATAPNQIPGQQVATQPNLGQKPAANPPTGISLARRQNLASRQQANDSIENSVPPVGDKLSLNSPSRTAENNPFIDGLGNGSKPPSPPEVSTNSTLFDTPQIAEAREYIKKRWQPPTGLRQTLEYSLLLGIDGKVERILPLNKPAREFVNDAGIPDIGKPFVSANRYGQNVRIRVVLTPDGKVQAFPESE
jgi:hypothetical protein